MGISDLIERCVCCDSNLCCDCGRELSGKELEPTWIVGFPWLHVLCKGCHTKRFWGEGQDGSQPVGETGCAEKPSNLPKCGCDS